MARVVDYLAHQNVVGDNVKKVQTGAPHESEGAVREA